jgi:hypothetical protein
MNTSPKSFTLDDARDLIDQHKLIDHGAIEDQPMNRFECARYSFDARNCLKIYLGLFKDCGFMTTEFARVIDCPIEDVPLYINVAYRIMGTSSGEISVKDIAQWRLRIGK